jgi:hypothetical protein
VAVQPDLPLLGCRRFQDFVDIFLS